MKQTKAASKHVWPQVPRKSSAATAPSRTGCRQQPTARKLEFSTRSADVGAVGSGLQVNRERYGVVALIGAIHTPGVEPLAASDRCDSWAAIQQLHGALIDVSLPGGALQVHAARELKRGPAGQSNLNVQWMKEVGI
jgi:hypothetical protein